MALGDAEALWTMYEAIKSQIEDGHFFLVRAPERTGFWVSEFWREIAKLLPEDHCKGLNHQVLDECRLGLRCQ